MAFMDGLHEGWDGMCDFILKGHGKGTGMKSKGAWNLLENAWLLAL